MKMKSISLYNILIIFTALVWIVSGLFCKVLSLVPRHEEIVARILGDDYSNTITIIIGCLEIIMAIWILTTFRSQLNAVIQIIIVSTMNILEFILVPDLLLWGRFNILFATLFIGLVYYTNFKHQKGYV